MMALVASLFKGRSGIKAMKLVRNIPGLSRSLLVSIVALCFYAIMLQARYLGALYSPPEQADSPLPQHYQHYADKFSIMRQGGRTEGNVTSGLILDALSVGTQYKLELLEAQSKTWASHKSIRHYFAATELDDADKTCYKTLNRTAIEKIVDLCVNEQPLAKGGMKLQYKKSFSLGSFFQRGAGWMCAQQRFAVAVEILGRLYRKQLQIDDDWVLPDFLLMQDDDTYYNMVRMHDFLQDKDPSIPLAEAPCLIRHAQLPNVSFPWGGYGFILSRASIENLIRPIHCNVTGESDEFQQNVCLRLEDDILGERQYFRNGMSISDLMGAHVRNNLLTQFSRDNWAYCLHGDWALGYFVSYYYISSHVKEPGFDNVPEVRIEGTLGGTYNKKDKGNCIYGSVVLCTEAAHVCHRQTAKSMTNRTKEVAAKAPGAFINFS